MPWKTVIYCPIPDGEIGDSGDAAKDSQSISSGTENPCNARIYAEASTSACNFSAITRENTTVNDKQEISQLDHSVYDLGDHPNEPNDMSSPIKPGGFFPQITISFLQLLYNRHGAKVQCVYTYHETS